MTIEEIRKGKPDGATHFTIIMFLGVVYIKYIDNYSWWFDNQFKQWIRTNEFTEAKPL